VKLGGSFLAGLALGCLLTVAGFALYARRMYAE
jgi:hypothetical protein